VRLLFLCRTLRTIQKIGWPLKNALCACANWFPPRLSSRWRWSRASFPHCFDPLTGRSQCCRLSPCPGKALGGSPLYQRHFFHIRGHRPRPKFPCNPAGRSPVLPSRKEPPPISDGESPLPGRDAALTPPRNRHTPEQTISQGAASFCSSESYLPMPSDNPPPPFQVPQKILTAGALLIHRIFLESKSAFFPPVRQVTSIFDATESLPPPPPGVTFFRIQKKPFLLATFHLLPPASRPLLKLSGSSTRSAFLPPPTVYHPFASVSPIFYHRIYLSALSRSLFPQVVQAASCA